MTAGGVEPDVEITRPRKLLWPALGVTKERYVAYLEAVADHMLPWLARRPLTVVRAPDGVDGKRYFQKTISSYAPPWIPTVELPAPSAGRSVPYPICDDRATLRWLGNQAALEFHPAPVRVDRLDRPDLLVVDIDPPHDAFDAAVEVARLVLEVLEDLDLPNGIKTTGGKGLHIVVPIERRYDAGQLRSAAGKLADIVVDGHPDLVTDEFRKAKRAGRVMLDPSRNGTTATIVAPFSPRLNAAGTVSFPVVAEELGSIAPGDFTLTNVPSLLDRPGPARWMTLAGSSRRLPSALTR